MFYENGIVATFSYYDKNLVLLATGSSKLKFSKRGKTYYDEDVLKQIRKRKMLDSDLYKMFDLDFIEKNNWFELFSLEKGRLSSLEMVWGTYNEAMLKSFLQVVNGITDDVFQFSDENVYTLSEDIKK